MKSELLIVIPAYNEEENIENSGTITKAQVSNNRTIIDNTRIIIACAFVLSILSGFWIFSSGVAVFKPDPLCWAA